MGISVSLRCQKLERPQLQEREEADGEELSAREDGGPAEGES